MLIFLTGIVAFGWTFGVALVALPVMSRLAPRGWALREFSEGRPRLVALAAGLVLFLAATGLFLIVNVIRV